MAILTFADTDKKSRTYPPGDYIMMIKSVEGPTKKDRKSQDLNADVRQIRLVMEATQQLDGQDIKIRVSQWIEVDSSSYKSRQMWQLQGACNSVGADYVKDKSGRISLDTDDLIGLEGVATLKPEKNKQGIPSGYLEVDRWKPRGAIPEPLVDDAPPLLSGAGAVAEFDEDDIPAFVVDEVNKAQENMKLVDGSKPEPVYAHMDGGDDPF